MDSLAELTAKFHSVWPLLDEHTRRLVAASKARALGYGGASLVRRACGLFCKARSVRGANAIIALRGCILSGRFENFCASRTP